jgi:NAD(P)-dependent dehydrogenase (short-subunit alcohol dehydrogenase family)
MSWGGRRRLEIGRSGSSLDHIKQEKGKLDIVFANAGMAKYGVLGSITEKLFDTIFAINVNGVLFTISASPSFRAPP